MRWLRSREQPHVSTAFTFALHSYLKRSQEEGRTREFFKKNCSISPFLLFAFSGGCR